MLSRRIDEALEVRNRTLEYFRNSRQLIFSFSFIKLIDYMGIYRLEIHVQEFHQLYTWIIIYAFLERFFQCINIKKINIFLYHYF